MPRTLLFTKMFLWILLCPLTTLILHAQTAPGAARKLVENSDDNPVLRQKTQVVTLNVSVLDQHNNPVIGLTKNNFEIYENKVKQDIEYFADADQPLSIGVIFDLSASMESKMPKAREALKSFVETSHADDEYFLVTFSDHARLVQNYTDGDQMLQYVNKAQAYGNTALYDAVYLGLENLREAGHKKKVLLVISDGEDNRSRYSLQDLKRYVKESETIIYCLSISETSGSNCGAMCQRNARRALEEISEYTGGRAYFPLNLNELEKCTSNVALELRRQYSIGYVSTQNVNDGKWRKIATKVKLENEPAINASRIRVRTKEGYFAIP